MPRRRWPDHELSNYRIARRKFDANWSKRKDGGDGLWEKVRNNALRLAEAIDKIGDGEVLVAGSSLPYEVWFTDGTERRTAAFKHRDDAEAYIGEVCNPELQKYYEIREA